MRRPSLPNTRSLVDPYFEVRFREASVIMHSDSSAVSSFSDTGIYQTWVCKRLGEVFRVKSEKGAFSQAALEVIFFKR